MKETPYLLAPAADTDTQIVVLQCQDQLHFDPAPLNRLFAEKSQEDAENVICRVLEDIAYRLDILHTGMQTSDFSSMLKPARRICTIADQIGLTEVSISAQHVEICLHQRDGVALEATVARLERGFEVAVSEVWNFRDF